MDNCIVKVSSNSRSTTEKENRNKGTLWPGRGLWVGCMRESGWGKFRVFREFPGGHTLREKGFERGTGRGGLGGFGCCRGPKGGIEKFFS